MVRSFYGFWVFALYMHLGYSAAITAARYPTPAYLNWFSHEIKLKAWWCYEMSKLSGRHQWRGLSTRKIGEVPVPTVPPARFQNVIQNILQPAIARDKKTTFHKIPGASRFPACQIHWVASSSVPELNPSHDSLPTVFSSAFHPITSTIRTTSPTSQHQSFLLKQNNTFDKKSKSLVNVTLI